MKKLLFIAVFAVLGCSKASDPSPIFPVPALLGTWQLAYENVSDCGSNNNSWVGTSNQKLILTAYKAYDGNYKATYQGNNLFEYQLKGDSLFLYAPKYSTDGVYQGITGFQKGIYQLSNVIQFSGKFTIINQLTGCSFYDYYQR